MSGKPSQRRFGNVRKRESGRWQARYRGADGRMHSAPNTFARKSEAERWLTMVEAQMVKQEWIDPRRAQIAVKDYAARWIVQRANLRPRTVQLYRWILEKHIDPYLGDVPIGRLTTPMIRQWREKLLTDDVSVSSSAKAYRLLRAVLMTAVKEDELIRVNPCRVPGADQEKPAERPVLSIAQVGALVARLPERYRALVLVATYGSLRWGEVSALQRHHLNLEKGIVSVRQAYSEIRGQGLILGPTKTGAGRRNVTLPAPVVAALTEHLDSHVDDAADAFVFTTPAGRPIWRGNFNKLVSWKQNTEAIGAAGLHFHDLRHTGNTLAAQTGASLKDLMTRMGHDSPRAALIYQHASAEADAAIAAALALLMTQIADNRANSAQQEQVESTEADPASKDQNPCKEKGSDTTDN